MVIVPTAPQLQPFSVTQNNTHLLQQPFSVKYKSITPLALAHTTTNSPESVLFLMNATMCMVCSIILWHFTFYALSPYCFNNCWSVFQARIDWLVLALCQLCWALITRPQCSSLRIRQFCTTLFQQSLSICRRFCPNLGCTLAETSVSKLTSNFWHSGCIWRPQSLIWYGYFGDRWTLTMLPWPLTQWT